MKIERQKAMVKSVAKSIRQKEKAEKTKDIARIKLTEVLDKYGKAIDEILIKEINKKEYEIILNYFKIVQNLDEYKVKILYPNLKA